MTEPSCSPSRVCGYASRLHHHCGHATGDARRVSHQLLAAEADVRVAADDDVIVNGDAEWLGRRDDQLGHVDIGARRRRITRWVIVDQDDR